MSVNQSPEYMKADEQYHAAKTPEDKLRNLEEMLRLVPKHKASEKLQSLLKQKIKVVRKEMQQPKRRSAGHVDPFAVAKQGAGQVALLGSANVGKSAIVRALTDARVEVADFPFSTHAAVPGMALHEDVPIQLVDMPPVIDGQAQPGMLGLFRSADVVLLVVDLSAIDLLDQFEKPLALLTDRGLQPVSEPSPAREDHRRDAGATMGRVDGEDATVPIRALVAANKCDTPAAQDNFQGLQELCGGPVDMLPVSAETGEGLAAMMAELYRLLNVIRIYAKKPGKPADRKEPFILPIGGTVQDMAGRVHRELSGKLKTARAWGSNIHDGQQVHLSHVLSDKDVVELHF